MPEVSLWDDTGGGHKPLAGVDIPSSRGMAAKVAIVGADGEPYSADSPQPTIIYDPDTGDPIEYGDPVETTPATVDTATVTSVASSAISATLVAANAARTGLIISNDDVNPLYIKLGATASLTSYTAKILGGGYWEMVLAKPYTGIVDGIWSADGSGSARITEL